ncbi:hypothetical protein [Bradyrhizobium sp. 33ap4]|uniref:hypothetical protein n=1 Tax=Bradyrhizobium sp. 33ap4 TaxID=3061630 RepID=UPI00292CBC49|nr:hypothetical protein [Bradyrhizobium sp. 33ap4]
MLHFAERTADKSYMASCSQHRRKLSALVNLSDAERLLILSAKGDRRQTQSEYAQSIEETAHVLSSNWPTARSRLFPRPGQL